MEAINLALELEAEILVMDDRDGRTEALECGLTVIGNLGVIASGVEAGLLDIVPTINRLRRTSFRAHPKLLAAMLKRFA